MYRYFILMLLFAVVFSCQKKSETTGKRETPILAKAEEPTRILNAAFLIMDGTFNTELTAPMDILQHTIFHSEYGMNVFTVAADRKPITTFEGLKIIPDFGYLMDSIPSIDILVVASAEHHLDTDLENQELIAWVRKTGDHAQYVMSLCDGAFVLAKSGLLDHVESTTFPSDIPQFKQTFPHLAVHENVSFVHHGKFLTSAGGAKSFDPALYLSELLYGNKAAKGIAGGLVIDWDLSKIEHKVVE